MDFRKPTARELREAQQAREIYEERHFGPNDINEDVDVKESQTSDVKIPWGSPDHPDEREGKRNHPGFADRH